MLFVDLSFDIAPVCCFVLAAILELVITIFLEKRQARLKLRTEECAGQVRIDTKLEIEKNPIEQVQMGTTHPMSDTEKPVATVFDPEHVSLTIVPKVKEQDDANIEEAPLTPRTEKRRERKAAKRRRHRAQKAEDNLSKFGDVVASNFQLSGSNLDQQQAVALNNTNWFSSLQDAVKDTNLGNKKKRGKRKKAREIEISYTKEKGASTKLVNI